MIRDLLLRDLSLWGCLWQSTTFLALGIVAGRLLRRRPSRAYQVLLFAMVAAVFVPFLSAVVRHYHLGVLTARAPELQREPLGELGTASFDATDASMAKDNRSGTLPEPISSGPVAASPAIDGTILGRFMLHAWIVATIALLARLAVTFLYGTHLVRRAHRVACEPMQKAADVAAAKVGLPRGLQARACDRIRSPVVWCWTRPPILLVPSDCKNSQTDWAGVVAHELAHCKRWDHLTGLLAELAVSLLPWNPLMWLSKRQLIRLGEEACDDWVVATGHPSEDYAESLLRFRPQRQMAFVPAVVHSRTGVAARVRRILNDACGNPRMGTKWALGISIVVVCVAVGFAFAQTRPAEPDAATTRQQEPIPQSANKPTAADKTPEQHRFTARTFNSKMAFDVVVMETSATGYNPRVIGSTPSATRLAIPACVDWWVQPSAPVKDWDLLAREINENKVPGLKLDLTTPADRRGELPALKSDLATDADMKHLAGLASLQSLDLSQTQVGDAGLADLKGLSALQSLTLEGTQVTDAGLDYLKGLSQLQSLDLAGTKITDAGVGHLKGLTALSILWLCCEKVTDVGLEQLEGMTGLKELHLGGTQVTDAGLEHLKGLRKLKYLGLEGVPITGAGMEHLKDLPELDFLFLQHTQLTDTGLEHLKGFAKLRSLYLGYTPITGAGLAHLKGLTELSLLDIVSTKVTDSDLENLKGMTGLTFLNLSNTQITDAGLQHLSGLSGLTTLHLADTRITGVGLKYLKSLTQLKELVLFSTEVTDAGLENLRGLSMLRYLVLCRTRITDAGLIHLEGLPRLGILNLSLTQITDAGLEHLKGLTGLQLLYLSSTQVTDAGLEHLKGLTGLAYLDLTGTRVTDAGAQQLKQNLPKLTVSRGQTQ